MASNFAPDEMGDTTRPSAITALGILSYINTGLFLLLYALGALMMTAVKRIPFEEFESRVNEAIQNGNGVDPEKVMEVLPIIYNSGATFLLILFLRTLMRFIGLVGIWRGKRTGFMTYAVAQVVGIFAPYIVLPWSMFSYFGAILSLAMVGAFASQLKRLQ